MTLVTAGSVSKHMRLAALEALDIAHFRFKVREKQSLMIKDCFEILVWSDIFLLPGNTARRDARV